MDNFSFITSQHINYSFIDKNKKYFCQSWYQDAGFQRELHLTTIKETNIRPYALQMEIAETTLKEIKTTNPVDIRVFVDSVEIADNEKKNELINGLDIFEYATKTELSFRKLTSAMKRKARVSTTIRNQLQQSISSGAIMNLSETKIKKIKEAIKDIL